MRKGKFIKTLVVILCLVTIILPVANNKSEAASGNEPYLGQIELMATDFAPVGWAVCDGRALAITQNMALYSLIGTKFGGDGVATFKVPNLSGPVSGTSFYMCVDGLYYSGILDCEQLVGQIELFPYNTTPEKWILCDGSSLNILSNTALYAIIGTNYGGNGSTTFNVPDLRGTEPGDGMKYYIASDGYFPSENTYSRSENLMGSIEIFHKNSSYNGDGLCDGGTLARNSNPALYSLLGTRFGGDGISTFGKPDLRGATPHPSIGYFVQTSGYYPARP